jgi:hypothetical protein
MLSSSEEDFKLRGEFGDWDDSCDEPEVNNWGSYGVYKLVGHGKKTSDTCGKFSHFVGCNRVEKHNVVTLDGVDFRGKVYVRKVHFSCGKPSCPVCYKSGWAVRLARNIEGRLAEASLRFGQVEHIVVSVPEKDYGLKFKSLRLKIVKVLSLRGVIGGSMIFHAFRYRDHDFVSRGIRYLQGWYWSPHFHVLGFIFGGYSQCRHCDKGALACLRCSGFEGRTRRFFDKDGYIIKVAMDKHGVAGKRVTVGGTAWYQLNHSSYRSDAVRFHIATWFGCCSYRKLKVTVERRKEFCPICNKELLRLDYHGYREFVFDRCCSGYEREEFLPINEGSGDVWVKHRSKGFG